MNDNKLKHLEFIQAIISRMASNSFLLKGWTITIVSALFALAAKDAELRFVLVSYFAIPCFWLLDGYFLSVERQYRGLYGSVSAVDPDEVTFSLDPSPFNRNGSTWIKSTFSKTLLIFYGAMLGVVLIVMFGIPFLSQQG